MRDILDKLDGIGNKPLKEARGLSARNPGEQFQRVGSTDESDVITFQGLDFYPKTGSYDTAEKMLAAYEKVASQLYPAPEMVNRPNSGTRAFGIVKFDTAVGPRYLAKFAQDIKPVRTANTFWQTKDIPGNFTQLSSRGAKEKIGYKPSDVLTDFKNQTPATIFAQIESKFGPDHPITNATRIFYESSNFPVIVPGAGIDFTAFRDYFCELLQPVALIQEKPVTGNAAQAAEVFLGGDYSDCTVSFNEGVSGQLFDSLLVAPNGRQIKLSSKGAKGAMASVINLLKSAQEIKEAGVIDLTEEYQDVIEILEIVKRGDHNTGPLELAVKFGIIVPSDIPKIENLTQYSGQKRFDIKQVPGINNRLVKIYNDRTADDPSKVVPYNHMIASLAYKVCDYVNLNTNFSEAAADILNNSAFVQMYTEAAKKGDDIIIKGFRSVWPSKLFTEVTLEAQKSYSSTTSSSGRMVFNINKEPKSVPNVDRSNVGEPDAATGTDDLEAVDQKRSQISARSKGVEPEATARELGRKRRKK
jgi:hypothetical protein